MKNWDLARFATVAEIGASIGVMISVIYLGIQIRGSNEQLRAQSYNDTLEILHKPFELIVQDQGLADLVVRGERDPESLSPGEWQRYSYLLVIRYYARRDGEIPEEIWKGIESSLTANLTSNKGFRRFWVQKGSIYAEPFHGFVESKLSRTP